MNVSLVAQILSTSLAEAIDLWDKMGHTDFKRSEATTEFMKHIDVAFDMMNSQHPLGRGFKAAMTLDIWHMVTEMQTTGLVHLQSERSSAK